MESQTNFGWLKIIYYSLRGKKKKIGIIILEYWQKQKIEVYQQLHSFRDLLITESFEF